MDAEDNGRVLVLEEDDAMSGWLCRVIAAAGHSVRRAKNVSELLEPVEEMDPEVIASEAGTPAASALELQIALAQGKGSLPIIFLTTPSVESGVRALLSGGFRHLFKPVPVRVLQETVLEALIARRLGRAGGSWRGRSGIVRGERSTHRVTAAELDELVFGAVAAGAEPIERRRQRRTPDPDR